MFELMMPYPESPIKQCESSAHLQTVKTCQIFSLSKQVLNGLRSEIRRHALA